MAGEMTALVGRNIRLAREQRGFNQRELAEELRKREPTRAAVNQRVSDWERGVQKPNEHYMRLLSDILDRPIAWFYEDGHERPTPEPLPTPAASDDMVGQLLARLESIDEQLRLLRANNEARQAELIARIDERTEPIQAAPPRRRHA